MIDLQGRIDALAIGQADLARLLGKDATTINRWCRPNRPDHVPPPRYALVVLDLLAAMPATARAEAMDRITAPAAS